MSGYAVAGRVQGAAVHVRSAVSGRASTSGPLDHPAAVVGRQVHHRGAYRLRDRVADLVVAIDQLTWYLRSPESWR